MYDYNIKFSMATEFSSIIITWWVSTQSMLFLRLASTTPEQIPFPFWSSIWRANAHTLGPDSSTRSLPTIWLRKLDRAFIWDVHYLQQVISVYLMDLGWKIEAILTDASMKTITIKPCNFHLIGKISVSLWLNSVINLLTGAPCTWHGLHFHHIFTKSLQIFSLQRL